MKKKIEVWYSGDDTMMKRCKRDKYIRGFRKNGRLPAYKEHWYSIKYLWNLQDVIDAGIMKEAVEDSA